MLKYHKISLKPLVLLRFERNYTLNALEPRTLSVFSFFQPFSKIKKSRKGTSNLHLMMWETLVFNSYFLILNLTLEYYTFFDIAFTILS